MYLLPISSEKVKELFRKNNEIFRMKNEGNLN